MDHQQLERFGQAVHKKKRAAKEASVRPATPAADDTPISGDQDDLVEHGRPQDVRDPRQKNSSHGKMTADKWNQ